MNIERDDVQMPLKTKPLRHQLELALNALNENTGLKGRVIAPETQVRQERRADALVEFRVEKRAQRFAVEARAAVDRVEALGLLKNQLNRFHQPGLLFTPYITHTIAQKCRELDVPFMDAAGNAYIRMPGFFVFITGQKPHAQARAALEARGLNTETALRMVFGLLCRPELLNAPYREIRDATGVALGAIGGVFRDLQKRGYLAGGFRKRNRRLLETDRLFEEWVTNYPIKLRPKLNPRRFRAKEPGWWRTTDVVELDAQWGGEVAARRLTQHLKPATVTLYIPPGRKPDPVPRLVRQHRLRADPAGDIDVFEKFWTFPADPAMPDIVPPILVYADLCATLDPRNLEVAGMIRQRYIDDALHTI